MTSLAGHFRSPEVTWHHLLSGDCLLLRATFLWEVKSTGVFGLQPIQVTSGQMMSLLGHFRSPEVTWRHLLLRASLVGSEIYSIQGFSAYSQSRWLPAKWRHFWVTSGHLRSRDIISCHVTASYCELQPCRKWNVQYTRVFGLLQALPGGFRSNDVSSESLPVTWGHVTFPVTWLPPTASYSLVRSEMYSICEL